jgi:hypothetical protein
MTTVSASAWDASFWVYNGTYRYMVGLRTTGLYYMNSSQVETQLYAFTPSTTTYYDLRLANVGGTVHAYLDGTDRGALSSPYASGQTPTIGFGDATTSGGVSVVRWNLAQAAAPIVKGMTLATWVYIDPNESTGGYLINKDWTSSQTNYRLSLGADNKVSFTLGDGASTATITTNSAITASAWHFVAATVDTSGVMTLYVDGVVAPSSSGSFTSALLDAVDNTALSLGGSSAGTTAACFKGKLDNVRIYASTLSATDIHRLAIDPPAAPTSGSHVPIALASLSTFSPAALPTMGGLPSHAVLVGAAFKQPSIELADSVLMPSRLRVDAAMASLSDDDGEEVDRFMDLGASPVHGLERAKVLTALDAYFDVKN